MGGSGGYQLIWAIKGISITARMRVMRVPWLECTWNITYNISGSTFVFSREGSASVTIMGATVQSSMKASCRQRHAYVTDIQVRADITNLLPGPGCVTGTKPLCPSVTTHKRRIVDGVLTSGF